MVSGTILMKMVKWQQVGHSTMIICTITRQMVRCLMVKPKLMATGTILKKKAVSWQPDGPNTITIHITIS